jgi:Dyp-type peroxidase family
MTVNLDEQKPINPNDAQVQQMLINLQGNILKGHGRNYSVHIFIKLNTADIEATRASLVAVANRIVTSALQQHLETEQFQKFGIPGAIFGNLLLTARGYRALGFTEAQLEAAFSEEQSGFGIQSNFREGMQAHSDELNDPAPSDWEEGYRAGEIDAMILLADDDETFLLRQARALTSELEKFSTVLVIERGNALRTDSEEGIEHFGYVDGRSQPIYFTDDLAKEGKIDKWNPVERLKIVLVPDKTVSKDDSFGSYFVFRKLEQDVRRFKIREEQLADELKLKGAERERAGATAVGRFEDGTPLTLSQTDGFIPIKENNFTYQDDPDGTKCPFHAHIRKSNPRGDTTGNFDPLGDETERSRRITRRGITYGNRNRHPDAFQALEDLPTEGVGLLFMCFQSSIANQFAFMQAIWINNPDFARPIVKAGPLDTGLDPVVGQGTGSEQHWPLTWGGAETKDFDFSGFVKLKGGEFFFAPSIPFLKVLSPPVSSPTP